MQWPMPTRSAVRLRADYALNDCTTLGLFWQSAMKFSFTDAVQVTPLVGPSFYQDMRITQPDTYGLGLANHALMNGNLLLSADVYYIPWSTAALWQDVFVDQWAFAVGTQYTMESYRFRAGYAYSTDPIKPNVGGSLAGFPLGQSTVQLIQAAAVPLVYKDRLTLGVGKQGVMVPNLDVDLFGGLLFQGTGSFGPHTTASLAMYYLGAGFTWKFGDCSPQPSEPSAKE